MKKKLLGTIDQNMIDDENKKIQKTFKVIGGDILREKKKHKQKTKVRTHSRDEKKMIE